MATIKDLVGSLIYSNYRHNRELNPEISPERWKKVYGAEAVDFMEEAYQKESSGNLFAALPIPAPQPVVAVLDSATTEEMEAL